MWWEKLAIEEGENGLGWGVPEEYFGRDESETEEAGVQQAESEYENPYFCEHCGRMRVYSHTTVTSGGITYTVILEHCDIHRKKAA